MVKSLKIINWNNFLEPKASSTTIVQIADKLLAKISGLENKISIVPQALSEETTAKLELQHEVKTLYKKYKIVSDQLEKRLKN